jgi:O-antigen ligase
MTPALRTASALALGAVFFLPFSKSLLELFAAGALAAWALDAILRRRLPPLPALGAVYAAFLAVTALSVTWAPAELKEQAVRGTLKWVKYAAVSLMAADLARRDRTFADRFVSVFLASAALACGDGLYQLWSGVDLVKRYPVDIPGRFTRMSGPFGSPNGLAALLLLAVPLSFARWLGRERWGTRAAAAAALLALTGVSLVLTLSRSALLALAAAALVLLIRRGRWRAFGAAAALAAGAAASPVLRENFFLSFLDRDITVGERLRFWATTLDMIRAHPALGHGVNTYYAVFPRFAPAAETYRGYAQNCYLQMAAEVGVAGLALFAVPVAARMARWLRRDGGGAFPAALWVALAASLAKSAVDTDLYSLQPAYLFWLFWGVAAAFDGGAFIPPRPVRTAPSAGR